MKMLLIVSVALALFPFDANAGSIRYTGSSTVGKFITDAKDVYEACTFKIDTLPESSGGENAPPSGDVIWAGSPGM